MRLHPRYAVALALGVVLAAAATLWSITVSRDRPGFDVADLVRVEPLPDPSASPLDEHLNRLFDAWNGEDPWTDAELADRWLPALVEAAGGSAQILNEGDRVVLEEEGRRGFVAMADRQPDMTRAIAVTERGTPFSVLLVLADDARLETLGIDPWPLPPPLKGWATALSLTVAWLFLAAGAAAARYGQRRHAWGSWAAAMVSLSAVLVLSRSSVAYTIGRTLPAVAAAVAVWLLVGGARSVGRRWLLAAAGAAVAVAVVAPFTRDATRIGHPAVVGGFADSESTYRTLLAVSAVLVGLAFAGVATLSILRLRSLSRWRRPPEWVVLAAATLWSLAAIGSAIDHAFGDGASAGGSLRAAGWVAFGTVGFAIALDLVSSRWDNPELANLVIDLDAEGSELRSAIARALEDASVELVTSDDGETLIDETGAAITAGQLPQGRTLTLIRSHGTLVGGLVHDAALQIHPARVASIAATAGMAIEVGRLNRRVLAQLDDVTASRARIVQASDAARHRIERDLHDGAQQRLVGLGLTLQRARRMTGSTADATRTQLLDEAGREVREIIEDIRAVSRGSHPALLAERGLTAALDALAERAPVPVRIDVASEPIPDDAATTVYFVVAEALTNIAKHADASAATVAVERRNGSARVEIADDGRGGATMSPGSGLQGLDDRVAAAGGSLAIRSGIDGTTLEAEIPCA
ncbi:histidine kinase [Ilumatobacter sp.]|uniref:sensor histidine kinase n=1 Tax=Ilumatobacter sp. TaxID=1967498 RepID=UPI003AF60BE7